MPPPQSRRLHEQKVVFLHIQKTAGTSVVEFFRPLYQATQFLSHGEFLNALKQNRRVDEIAKEKLFVSGHFGYAHIAHLLPEAYSFVFLRDPVARAVSLYNFCFTEGMEQFEISKLAKSLPVREFFNSTHPEVCQALDNHQVWQLIAWYTPKFKKQFSRVSEADLVSTAFEHLSQFNRVCLTEHFETDFSQVLNDLGMEKTAGVSYPHEYVFDKVISRDSLDSETVDIIRNRSSMDQTIYDFVNSSRQ